MSLASALPSATTTATTTAATTAATAITVLPELQAYIDPLSADEYDALERSILTEGCRDALVLWGDILVDGHNRYGICQKHGLPFHTVQNPRFHSLEDVHLWMIDQHLGRRSVSDFQRGVLALRKREIIAQRRSAAAAAVQAAAAPETADAEQAAQASAQALASVPAVPNEALDTREALARAARLSPNQVKLIETIQEKAAPEVVAAVKNGELSLNAAAVVAQLPLPEQQSTAEAGPQALKDAAKRVRQARKQARSVVDAQTPAAEEASAADPAALQQRIDTLEAENQRLRLQVQTLQELLAQQEP